MHAWVHVHFVVTGCIYYWPLIGVDPMPNRLPHFLRIFLIFITMPFHAFLGVIIMGSPQLIAEDWYPGLQPGLAAQPARRPEHRRRHHVGGEAT